MTTPAVQSRVLKAACQTGEFEPLKELAAHVNTRDELGSTLLMRFLERTDFSPQHLETLPRLITELGASVSLVHAKTQKTALDIAAVYGHVNAARILFEYGAVVDSKDCIEATPLIFCSSFDDNSRMIDYLLSRGAYIDSKAKPTGWTALHFAVSDDKLENARALLMYGANRDLTDHVNRTPLALAKSDQMRELFARTVGETIQANLIAGHQELSPIELEEKFTRAFEGVLLTDYGFMFDVFKENPTLTPLVQTALQEKISRRIVLRDQIESTSCKKEDLKDDLRDCMLESGPRDAIERGPFIQDQENTMNRLRIAIELQDTVMPQLQRDLVRTSQQIDVLKRLKECFERA